MHTCFASKTTATVIDVLGPDGRTQINGKTLDDVRRDYPDAEEMTLDAFCEWKAARQDSPVTWEETTAERFDDMLGCLPPAMMAGGGFLVGEPWDHHATTGEPRYQAFRQRGGRFEVADRPMTRAEFRAEVAR